MGFLSELGKAFMGKPLGPQTQNQPEPATAAGLGSGILDQRGLKIIPDIDVADVRSHRNGDHLIVTVWVANNSDQQIRIDSGYLLKQKRQFNQDLAPRQSHELTLYEGPVPRDESEHHAQIVYRLHVNGDVFQVNYRIEYHLEPDGARIIDELHDDGPTRDI